MSELCRIQQDPAGGTEVVRDQLVAGTQTGWRSVTYANWARYGQRSLPLPNGGGRYASRMERQQSEVQAFCNHVEDYTAHRNAPLRTITLQ